MDSNLENIKNFADTVSSLCDDFSTHGVDPNYEFYSNFNLRMLVGVCKSLKDCELIDFSEDWIDEYLSN